MLLIWDIHINSRYQDRIISELKNFVNNFPDEKNIIFLWDYVYHFSYDRTALLALFNFFIDLFKQGKNVYILAWNHDWMGQHFVYQEAKTAFDLLKNSETNSTSIQFITKPELIDIEGQQIFFLPFFLAWDSDNKDLSTEDSVFNPIDLQIKILKQSQNKHEQQSARINQILLKQINQSKDTKLLVLHHHYINATKFPWQKARFNFKDIALSEHFLDIPNLKMISGHLHQSFIHKNYVCLGSVRSSSPLETNQIKVVAQYDVSKEELNFHHININPYLFIEHQWDEAIFVDKKSIQQTRKEVQSSSKKHLESNETRSSNLQIWDTELDTRYVSVTIKSESLDYDQIDTFIEKDLRMQVKDVKLKRKTAAMQELLEDFDIASKNLTSGIADRKGLLKAYLKQKYPDEHLKYKEFLQDMKLI